MEQKKEKVKFKDRKLNKSISLIIKNNNFSNIAKNSILYQYIPKTSYSVQTSDRKPKKNTGQNISNSNYLSKLYNLNFFRQNSQGSFCSLKKDNINNYNNNSRYSDINNKYPKLNIHHLSEIKCPKFIEYINNKRKKQNNNNYSNNYNERYYQNKIKNTAYYYKKLSQNSFNLANKNKNLSQRNINIKLKLEDYYDNSVIKTNKNHKNNLRYKLKEEESYLSKKTSGNIISYDKHKCIIERKFYGEDNLYKSKEKTNINNINNKNKAKINEKEKYLQIKTLSGSGDNETNKIFYKTSKNNMKKDLKKSGIDSNNNYNNNFSNHNINEKLKEHNYLSINNLINYKWSSSKILPNKSKTNHNILNASLEEINKTKSNNSNYNHINITHENKETKNSRYNSIKLIFPSFLNKVDLNDSSQESTNLMGNTFSNKITINNSNIVTRKDKVINSFLDGPEDIHSRFVDLHKQRKMFYENMCDKTSETYGNNNNMAKLSDFDKSEYSEYFDNFNEDVPII